VAVDIGVGAVENIRAEAPYKSGAVKARSYSDRRRYPNRVPIRCLYDTVGCRTPDNSGKHAEASAIPLGTQSARVRLVYRVVAGIGARLISER